MKAPGQSNLSLLTGNRRHVIYSSIMLLLSVGLSIEGLRTIAKNTTTTVLCLFMLMITHLHGSLLLQTRILSTTWLKLQ